MVDRHLDLSEGSHERAMVEAMAGQREIPVVWVNEGVESVYRKPDAVDARWRDVLENTRGISAQAWREEIEDLLWRQSESWRPGPRPRTHRRRTATMPAGVALPFFARRSGAIPRNGTPELAGVTLPRGSRQPARPAAYWASDEPVANIGMLAPWLASVFAQTGLWPLLWRLEEDPENYMYGGGIVDRIDDIDLEEIRAQHAPEHAGTAQAAIADPAPSEAPTDPFPARALEEPTRLLLVPCNRPADAVTALGGVAGTTDPPMVSAVLRRWEERHATILYEVAPSLTRLSIAHPPEDREQALAIATEARAILDRDDPRSASDLADELLGDTPHPSTTHERPTLNRDSWDIAV
jgi:hypothetical protein